jgi:anaerobic selenocysteine-containing dehydrogenase
VNIINFRGQLVSQKRRKMSPEERALHEAFSPFLKRKTSGYIIHNPRQIDLGQVKRIVEAKEKGAKLLVVDPRHSETAILADEWLPIKPGTDLAFLLAMINVMLKEELYDKKFVVEKTVGFEQLGDEIVIVTTTGMKIRYSLEHREIPLHHITISNPNQGPKSPERRSNPWGVEKHLRSDWAGKKK